jgi:hypothetical protein
MKRDDTLKILAEHRDELHRQFGIISLALFGSVARDEAGPESDVDLLVEFDRPITLFGLVAVQQYLEKILGVARVDVVMPDSIFPAIKDSILGEAIHVG